MLDILSILKPLLDLGGGVVLRWVTDLIKSRNGDDNFYRRESRLAKNGQIENSVKLIVAKKDAYVAKRTADAEFEKAKKDKTLPVWAYTFLAIWDEVLLYLLCIVVVIGFFKGLEMPEILITIIGFFLKSTTNLRKL